MASLTLLKPPCVTKTSAWLSAATWSTYRLATTFAGSSPSISIASSLAPTDKTTRTSDLPPKDSMISLQSRWLNWRPLIIPNEDTCSAASQRLSTVMVPRDTRISFTPGTLRHSSPDAMADATRGTEEIKWSVAPTQRNEELSRSFCWCCATMPCSSGMENTMFRSGLKNRPNNCDSKTSTLNKSLAISLTGRKPGCCGKDRSNFFRSSGLSAYRCMGVPGPGYVENEQVGIPSLQAARYGCSCITL
mmetsp:Transcript_116444/g.276766  ORF Transcript_116444/g.276766 Transcript_116444/m.276766 type:complete len:247 (+) Transcript_116444:542-1282(+)